jgi:hypothetical protein
MNRTVAVVVLGVLSATLSPSVATAASDGLLADIPAPPNGKSLGGEPISSGGQKASYSTSASISAVLDDYRQALAKVGWTVVGGGGGGGSYGGGGGLSATNGPKYLSLQAGGPAGTTYVRVCVWPERPADDNCG